MDSEGISRDQAAAALDTIEACRELIGAERAKQREPRIRSLLLGAITTLLIYASKDLIRSRARRWALIAGWQAAMFALAAVLRDMPRVGSRMPMSRPESLRRPAVFGIAGFAALAGAERLTVWSLRRSGLRWPNVVAGFVIAGLRTGFRAFLLDQVLHAGQRAEPAGSGQLHDALLRPGTLHVASLLGGGEVVELSFLRETIGVDRLGLAERMQPLVDDKLVRSITTQDSVRVFLSPEGRDAFVRHELALRELSTGGTPR